jgi:hypothetical protein
MNCRSGESFDEAYNRLISAIYWIDEDDMKQGIHPACEDCTGTKCDYCRCRRNSFRYAK